MLGINRQDVEFGSLSFQEWYKIRYGNALLNDEVISRFRRDYDNHFTLMHKKEKTSKAERMNVTGSDTGQGSRNQSFGDPDIIKNYFKEESTNQDEKPQECNPSLDEWMKRNWGTTKVDKKAKIKAFVEWMVEHDPDDAKPSDHDSDPYNKSFEKFNYEFETEVLKQLDEYELKIGKRGLHVS